jgi:DNA-binding SARP family transcriptional activator
VLTDLYDGAPPPSALSGLQAYVSHLRRTLEPHRAQRAAPTVLLTAPPGYALRLPAGAPDADAFAADLQAAEQLAGADPSRAVAHLDAALARWRGEAYAEVAFEPWAVPQAVRLTELRSRAQERRAELALTAQGGAAVVAELEALVREHPLREESWRLLVLALYDARRQGDALAALRRAREVLADERGLDPGEGLNADSGIGRRLRTGCLKE